MTYQHREQHGMLRVKENKIIQIKVTNMGITNITIKFMMAITHFFFSFHEMYFSIVEGIRHYM